MSDTVTLKLITERHYPYIRLQAQSVFREFFVEPTQEELLRVESSVMQHMDNYRLPRDLSYDANIKTIGDFVTRELTKCIRREVVKEYRCNGFNPPFAKGAEYNVNEAWD